MIKGEKIDFDAFIVCCYDLFNLLVFVQML